MAESLGIFAVVLISVVSSISCSSTTPNTNAATKDSGLNNGDVAAIILGILFLLLVVGTALLCLLYYKGCIGHREEQVIPFYPGIDTNPDSLRKCADAAFDRGKKGKYKCPVKVLDPIIYLNDDIYHRPKSRPLPTEHTSKEQDKFLIPTDVTQRRSSHRRHSRDKYHWKSHSLPRCKHNRHHPKSQNLPRSKSEEIPTVASYPDDAVFIPDKGGMKFTMYYETKSPYRDVRDLSKTV